MRDRDLDMNVGFLPFKIIFAIKKTVGNGKVSGNSESAQERLNE
jgi:hypothetical protein